MWGRVAKEKEEKLYQQQLHYYCYLVSDTAKYMEEFLINFMINSSGTWVSFCCEVFKKSFRGPNNFFHSVSHEKSHLVDFHCFSVRTAALFWSHCATYPAKTSSAKQNRFLVEPKYYLFSLGSEVLFIDHLRLGFCSLPNVALLEVAQWFLNQK